MKRTFEVDKGHVRYHNKYIGHLPHNIQERFNMLTRGKYEVSITKGGAFSFSKHYFMNNWCVLRENKRHLGNLCKDGFEKLFFKLDGRKNYSIVVKKK